MKFAHIEFIDKNEFSYCLDLNILIFATSWCKPLIFQIYRLFDITEFKV